MGALLHLEEAQKRKTKDAASYELNTYREDQPCPKCKEKELSFNQGMGVFHCAACGTYFEQLQTGKWGVTK